MPNTLFAERMQDVNNLDPVVGLSNENTTMHLQIPLVNSPDGHLHAVHTIVSKKLCQMAGITDPDQYNLKGASVTNLKLVGVDATETTPRLASALTYAHDGSPLPVANPVYINNQAGELIESHFGPTGGTQIYVPSDKETQKKHTKEAVVRELRYNGLSPHDPNLDAGIIKVGAGADRRYIVPQHAQNHPGDGTFSPVAAVIANNVKNNPKFCGGTYHNSKSIQNTNGQTCSVINGPDYDVIHSTFKETLSHQHPIQNGVQLNFRSVDPAQLSKTHLNPHVDVELTLHRDVAQTILGIDHDKSQPVTRQSCLMKILGETPAAAGAPANNNDVGGSVAKVEMLTAAQQVEQNALAIKLKPSGLSVSAAAQSQQLDGPPPASIGAVDDAEIAAVE